MPPRSGRRAGDPDLAALAHRALDAATAAGASYADVRFTVTHRRHVSAVSNIKSDKGYAIEPAEDGQEVAVGVRALVHGAWGFAADTDLTPDMVAWLGRTAAEASKATSWKNCPPVVLGERPPAAVGQWQTPGARDPFTVSDAEYKDFFVAFFGAAKKHHAGPGIQAGLELELDFTRQERTFASTDGALATQTLYTMFPGRSGTESSVRVLVSNNDRQVRSFAPAISPQGGGFEVFEREKLVERVPEWVESTAKLLDVQPLEASGRFDVVLDGYAMAAVVSSLGAALEIDRALGYEANAMGTSYLAPVAKVLGTQPFPSGVTLLANRTDPKGAATVQWDDDGVRAHEFPLIKDGTVVDYATSREFIAELASGYRQRGQPVQSRGCAGSASALTIPLVQTPNLRLQGDTQDTSFEELVSGIENGVAFLGGRVDADHQQLTALGGDGAIALLIKKGKLVGSVNDAGYMIRMPELWKNLVALGGERSAATRGFAAEKGQPVQWTYHSVRAPAARFRNVVVRKLSS